MNHLTYVIFISVLIAVKAQIEVPGSCPSHVVQSNFTLSAYLGKWFEIKRYQNSFQEKGDCVIARYSFNPDNSTINVTNEMLLLPNKTAVVRINGTGRLQSAQPPIDGRLVVNFNGNESDYWILNTDYHNYAVVWSCTNVGNNSMQSAWILSRTRTLSPEIDRKVNELFPNFHLNDTLFRKTEQSEKMCIKSSGSLLQLISPAAILLLTLFSQLIKF